mmetsp:Transcript_9505/g.23667  ORF Transcript_9505/g.23667 Transcript_9505/m.23667 type:complete len:90 (+) Transcript_9505:482-751(+)
MRKKNSNLPPPACAGAFGGGGGGGARNDQLREVEVPPAPTRKTMHSLVHTAPTPSTTTTSYNRKTEFTHTVYDTIASERTNERTKDRKN